jgi:hypothetical protein
VPEQMAARWSAMTMDSRPAGSDDRSFVRALVLYQAAEPLTLGQALYTPVGKSGDTGVPNVMACFAHHDEESDTVAKLTDF